LLAVVLVQGQLLAEVRVAGLVDLGHQYQGSLAVVVGLLNLF
jgi:hypothetical protein